MFSEDSDYSIRIYESGDEEAIVDLLKISFPEYRTAESPLDYWKWKYIENPYGSIVVVADWDGKIVGIKHRLFFNVKIDETVSSSYGDDSTVHPDYRKKGIYKNMVRYSEELSKEKKIVLRFGIQIHEAAVRMAENEGFVLFPFSISHMLQIRDEKTHFEKRPTKYYLLSRYGFYILKLLNRTKNTLKHKKRHPELKIKDISEFDENINTFWQNTKNHYHFIIEKNQEYLNWRYCDPRSSIRGRYYIKQAEKNGKILGFTVLETRKQDDYSEGYVIELLVLPDRLDVVRKLIDEATLFFRESGVNVVHYRVVKNNRYQALFREYGFIDVPSKMHMTYQIFQNKEKMDIIQDSRPDQIYFNYGDYY